MYKKHIFMHTFKKNTKICFLMVLLEYKIDFDKFKTVHSVVLF